MSELVEVKFGRKPAGDLSAKLREYANRVDEGAIIDFIGVYVEGGEYCFFYASSLSNSLVMATLLQSECVRRMKKE